MKKILLTLIVVLLSVYTLTAQTINGKVVNTDNQPIAYATVSLHSLPDSLLVTGAITDENGDFTLDMKGTKNAFLRITFVGFETKIAEAFSGQTITLREDSRSLGEVEVKGILPKIQLKNDALVTTVQGTVLSKAGTGSDVLKRIPLLTEKKSVYSVFGKGEAKIFINNREMRDIEELKNLSSADIQNVEVVTNPGARYDASVKAVIRINTVRKAGDGFGFDAMSRYNQSQNIDLTEQLNVNYRKNGWDVFGTVKYSRDNWFQDSRLWQKTYVDTLWTQENEMYIEENSKKFSVIGGVNYEISPKHSIGAKYTIDMFPKSYMTGFITSTVSANGAFYDKWRSDETITNDGKPSHHINVYYNGSLDKLSINLNSDFYTSQKYTRTDGIEKSQEYDNRTITSDNSVFNRLFASKLVLSYPIFGGSLSLGGEYTNTHRKDDYTNLEKLVPSTYTTINEQNRSLFMEYSLQTPIGQVGAGLRYENVNTEYLANLIRDDEQSRKYQQWFPSFSFATQIKEVGIQLSYTAKTRRPTYRELSSNVIYGNRFLLQTGNPYLKPSTVHDVSLVSSWKFVQFMFDYTDERNAIINWTTQDKNRPALSVLAFKNVGCLPSIDAALVVSPTFGIWTPQITGSVMKQWLRIESAGKQITLDKPLFSLSVKNSLRLPKQYNFTLDVDYTGKGDDQNFRLKKDTWAVNAAINKSFFNDRLDINLKASDIFYQQKDRVLLYNDKMELDQENKFDTRSVELTVRYKFNLAKSKYKGTGAGQSEIKRL